MPYRHQRGRGLDPKGTSHVELEITSQLSCPARGGRVVALPHRVGSADLVEKLVRDRELTIPMGAEVIIEVSTPSRWWSQGAGQLCARLAGARAVGGQVGRRRRPACQAYRLSGGRAGGVRRLPRTTRSWRCRARPSTLCSTGFCVMNTNLRRASFGVAPVDVCRRVRLGRHVPECL